MVKNRAETNTRFTRIFVRLHNYSNTFGYTTNDLGVVILVYFTYLSDFNEIHFIYF